MARLRSAIDRAKLAESSGLEMPRRTTCRNWCYGLRADGSGVRRRALPAMGVVITYYNTRIWPADQTQGSTFLPAPGPRPGGAPSGKGGGLLCSSFHTAAWPVLWGHAQLPKFG
jgi:hypothetical protein